ncbi:MAG: hypothetical protein WD404_07155 [Solirubrobacterales bacterium]
MRRNLLVTLALSALLAIGVAAIASAAGTTLRAGNLVLRFGGNVVPKKLPKKRFAPVALNSFGKIRTADGSHPSAFREAIVDIDRNGRVNARGVPACRGGQLQARTTAAAKRVCRRAIVGSGSARVQISFPEQRPIRVNSPLLIFNGGGRGGKTTMYIHSFITVPVPAAIVTTLTIKKIRKGRFGNRVVARVPVIAGGSGSALSFNFTIRKKFFRFKGRAHPYLEARCPDGRFQTRVLKALFRNETREAGVQASTNLRGGLVVPCTRGR